METKFCSRCQQDVPISGWILNKARHDGLSGYCRSCHNKLNKEVGRKKRHEFIQAMGGCCDRCGFSDERALQVDHVNGGGSSEHKGLNRSTTSYYKMVLKNTEKFQLLCANCQWIKRWENDECKGNNRSHTVPTVDREKSPGKHSPEANARRSETMKEFHRNNPDVAIRQSERMKNIHESKRKAQLEPCV